MHSSRPCLHPQSHAATCTHMHTHGEHNPATPKPAHPTPTHTPLPTVHHVSSNMPNRPHTLLAAAGCHTAAAGPPCQSAHVRLSLTPGSPGYCQLCSTPEQACGTPPCMPQRHTHISRRAVQAPYQLVDTTHNTAASQQPHCCCKLRRGTPPQAAHCLPISTHQHLLLQRAPSPCWLSQCTSQLHHATKTGPIPANKGTKRTALSTIFLSAPQLSAVFCEVCNKDCLSPAQQYDKEHA